MVSARTRRVGPFEKIAFRQILSWGLVSILLAFYSLLAFQSDMASAVPALVAVSAVLVSLLALVLYAEGRGAVRWSPTGILLVAAGLRVLFVFGPPELSDDLYQYLWDGLQLANGHNPYRAAPSAMLPGDEASRSLLGLVNHPDFITIYPPAAQLIFAAGAQISEAFWGLKILLLAMDLFTCFLILRLLTVLGLSPGRSILYAWHPLPILEIGSSGHIDGAGLFFLFLSLALLAVPLGRDAVRTTPSPWFGRCRMAALRTFLAGLAAATAVLVKLFPLFFLPGLLMLVAKGNRSSFLAGVLTGATVLVLPFMPEIGNLLGTLDIYLQNWEFSGLVFRVLRRTTLSGNSARLILASLFLVSAAAVYGTLRRGKTAIVEADHGERRRLPRVGALPDSTAGSGFLQAHPPKEPSKEPECRQDPVSMNLFRMPDPAGTAKEPGCVTDPPLCGVLPRVLQAFSRVTVVFLFLTPTFHPWYALYLVCFLPFTLGTARLVLSWGVFLSYYVLILYKPHGLWLENDRVPLWIWLAPACAFVLAALFKRSGKGEETACP